MNGPIRVVHSHKESNEYLVTLVTNEYLVTLQAFGIPDVEYEWLKNGKVLLKDNRTMDPEDRQVKSQSP